MERDFIKRLRDDIDRRCIIIHLTPQGEQVLQRLSLLHLHELQLAGRALVHALEVLLASESDTNVVQHATTNVLQEEAGQAPMHTQYERIERFLTGTVCLCGPA